jgi:hypothetical protein
MITTSLLGMADTLLPRCMLIVPSDLHHQNGTPSLTSLLLLIALSEIATLPAVGTARHARRRLSVHRGLFSLDRQVQ